MNGYETIKKDIEANQIAALYVCFGEESYLRESSFKLLKKHLVQKAVEGFDYVELDGAHLTLEELADALWSYPMGGQKKMILVRDFDIIKPPAAMKKEILELLSDIPEYACVIFSYETIGIPAGLKTSLERTYPHAEVVEFKKNEKNELVRWLKRRFQAEKKTISSDDCEYLIFITDGLMTTLLHEVEKISSYAKHDVVSRSDIDAVTIKVLDAKIYELTDALVTNPQKAIQILRELTQMRYEPIVLSGSVLRQMVKLYAAKLACLEKVPIETFMKTFGMKSSYPAKKLYSLSGSFSLRNLEKAIECCAKTDMNLKGSMLDKEYLLEMLLLRISGSKQEGKR